VYPKGTSYGDAESLTFGAQYNRVRGSSAEHAAGRA
jgi:hypothetical protein